MNLSTALQSVPAASSEAPAQPGISILLCCYNSAKRLPATLRALADLAPPQGFGIELLVVDNASTDDTATVAARELLALHPFFSYQVLHEARTGKSQALELGLEQARYGYVCIVDDDNWLSPDYLNIAWAIMEGDKAIGALGGAGEPVFEIPPPAWFPQFALDFAAGPQAPHSGDITASNRYVYGAGMVLRKQAWEEVRQHGFESVLTAVRGNKPSGEDNEMCYALVVRGYKIWYDARLRFQHFIAAERLTWQYLRKTYRVNAVAHAELRPWAHFMENDTNRLVKKPALFWLRNGAYMLRHMLPFLRRFVRSGKMTTEGDANAIAIFYYWQSFKEYVKKELHPTKSFGQVQQFVARAQQGTRKAYPAGQ